LAAAGAFGVWRSEFGVLLDEILTLRRLGQAPKLRNFDLYNQQVDEVMHRGPRESCGIGTECKDRVGVTGRDAAAQVAFEFFQQQRHTFLPAATLADRVFDSDPVGSGAVQEKICTLLPIERFEASR
jgi:hypothetical protein